MKRILIVDDHTLMRAGLRRLIGEFPDCSVVGEAADGRQALSLLKSTAADLVLLDISMPEMNGLDSCARLLQAFPEVKIILLSMHAAREFVEQGLATGARGYVVKEAAPEELQSAIRLVMQGQVFLSPRLSELGDAGAQAKPVVLSTRSAATDCRRPLHARNCRATARFDQDRGNSPCTDHATPGHTRYRRPDTLCHTQWIG